MLEEEDAMRGNHVLMIRSIMVILVLGVLATGCARKMPQEVIDVNRGLGQAKDACAGVYAADDLQAMQGEVDSMNQLADAKKYRKASKAAVPILPGISDLNGAVEAARAAAKAEAEAALAAADTALSGASEAEAPTLVGSAYGQAEAKLAEARRLSEDPCKYGAATAAARDAARLADNAAQAAVAERKRLDEEARLAEEERLRQEEEARRLEEERLKNMLPPTYTVAKGDSLWKISGMEKIYKDSRYWPIIHDANGALIANPDLIYAGQKLTITRGMERPAMDNKLHALWKKLAAGRVMEE
jgi:nucleoid-associated protein YgaU